MRAVRLTLSSVPYPQAFLLAAVITFSARLLHRYYASLKDKYTLMSALPPPQTGHGAELQSKFDDLRAEMPQITCHTQKFSVIYPLHSEA